MNKTKLSKLMREQFVKEVLADIKPTLDVDSVRKEVTAEALAALPPAILKLWSSGLWNEYIHQLSIVFCDVYRAKKMQPNGYSMSRNVGLGTHFRVPGVEGFRPSKALNEKVHKMLQDHATALDEKEAMGERLTAMAATAKTVNDLEEMFPLLTKYIPKGPVVLNLVPAVLIQSTMADLKKMGVPTPSKKP